MLIVYQEPSDTPMDTSFDSDIVSSDDESRYPSVRVTLSTPFTPILDPNYRELLVSDKSYPSLKAAGLYKSPETNSKDSIGDLVY